MSSSPSCKNCGSADLVVNHGTGDTVCEKCGVVLDAHAIVSEVQYEENAHGICTAIGQFVPSDGSTKVLGIGGAFRNRFQESREYTISKAKAEIERIGRLLKVNDHCLKTSLNFYTLLLDRHYTQGRRTSFVCAACLYISCRLEGTPHLLIDFSEALEASPFYLGRTFTAITQELYLRLPLIDPCVYVLRYAYQMKLGDKSREISTTALRIVKRMKKDFLHCGRRPSGLCGAALIISARLHGIKTKPKDVVKVFQTQKATIRKRMMEFGDTPSSLLTTDEFMSVDLEEAQDPPSFTLARLRDKERLKKFSDGMYEQKMKLLQSIIDKALNKAPNASTNNAGNNTLSGGKYDFLKGTLSSTIAGAGIEEKEGTVEGSMEFLESVLEDSSMDDSSSTKVQGNQENEMNESEAKECEGSEMERYILNDGEYKQKKKYWKKANSGFLQKQKRKAEERLALGKEAVVPKKKPKRRKEQIVAASAGEAVAQVLREKKVSKKLNYDVLKLLNQEDIMKSFNFNLEPCMRPAEESLDISSTSIPNTSTAEPGSTDSEKLTTQTDVPKQGDIMAQVLGEKTSPKKHNYNTLDMNKGGTKKNYSPIVESLKKKAKKIAPRLNGSADDLSGTDFVESQSQIIASKKGNAKEDTDEDEDVEETEDVEDNVMSLFEKFKKQTVGSYE